MSVRNYNLRTRADTGLANQSRVQNSLIPIRRPSTSPRRDAPPRMLGDTLNTGGSAALYSDIAASRPPSPQKETSSVTVVHPVVRPGDERVVISRLTPEDTSRVAQHHPDIMISKNVELHTSSEVNVFPEDPEDIPWTTVRRQRAHSLGSVERVRKNRSEINLNSASHKTASQKPAILHLQKKMDAHREPENLVPVSSRRSRREGPSQPKRKGLDPTEWGNLNISQESLDVEAQAAAFKSIAQGNKTRERRPTKKSTKTHRANSKARHSSRLPAESRPVAQIAQGSYLGMAL
jgi:hypothetical protein